MNTIRPHRAFIMARKERLATRKVPVRLASTTVAKSSSFIRRASMSRVMPALATRM